VDYIFLYKQVCLKGFFGYFLWVHKIEEDWCREWIAVILDFIFDYLVICFAKLLVCSFFLWTFKEKRTKKENRRLSLRNYSESPLG